MHASSRHQHCKQIFSAKLEKLFHDILRNLDWMLTCATMVFCWRQVHRHVHLQARPRSKFSCASRWDIQLSLWWLVCESKQLLRVAIICSILYCGLGTWNQYFDHYRMDIMMLPWQRTILNERARSGSLDNNSQPKQSWGVTKKLKHLRLWFWCEGRNEIDVSCSCCCCIYLTGSGFQIRIQEPLRRYWKSQLRLNNGMWDWWMVMAVLVQNKWDN